MGLTVIEMEYYRSQIEAAKAFQKISVSLAELNGIVLKLSEALIASTEENLQVSDPRPDAFD